MCFFKKSSLENIKSNDFTAITETSSFDENLNEKYGKTKNSLDATAVVNGKVCFDTSIKIEGKLNGEMTAKKLVIVGKSGVVNALIKAEQLIVLGVVKGDIEVTKGIEILAGGYVEGSIITPSITIETGAKFNGNCTMKFTEITTEETKECDLVITDEETSVNMEKEKEDSIDGDSYTQNGLLHH